VTTQTRTHTHTRTRAPVSGLVSLPGVNLLPPEIRMRRRLRRVQIQLGGAGVAAVLVVVALFLIAASSVSSANGDLRDAQAQRATLQEQVDGFNHVGQTYALVDQANGLLRDAGGNEVLWSSYLGDLGGLLPAGTWLTKVTVTAAPVAAAPPQPGVAPAAPPGIAQLTFEGTALAHVNVASWLDSIAKERGWANPYLSQSDEKLIGDRKVFSFSSTATVTTAALSGRYTTPAGD